ncbi:hypothetical protein D3C80_1610590 [compost metagenome]
MPGHIAETGWRTKNNRIIVSQLLWRRLRGILRFTAGFQERFRIHGFRNALYHHLNAINFIRTFRNGVSHGFDVSVHGIIEHQNFSHLALLLV